MSTAISGSLDMSAVLLRSYELGDLIKASKEAADYLYWKQQVEQSPEAGEWIQKLQQKKQLFEECRRFGHFHPDYHAALDEVKRVQEQLDAIDCVKRFKEAEDRLDDLLYEVSATIAGSVSESIKVPANKLLPESEGSGCSAGCGGGCGDGCG